MTGFDLILSAALCVTCANETKSISSKSSGSLEHYNFMLYDDIQMNSSARINAEYFKQLQDYVNGRHLRIATIEDYPLSYTELLSNGTRVGKGVSFELVDFLMEKYNFTYEVVVPEDDIIGSSGDYQRSLIEMLNSSQADLAAAFVPYLADPRNFVYYSTTVLDEGEWIMVMQRPKESATGSGLLAPFEFWVWILIFVSLLIVGPVIYLLIIIRNKITGDHSQKPYTLGHCAWFVYGALMKQGSTLSPVTDSTRLLFATWWIFITILTSFYTANLTAFLTLSKFTLPFNRVDDILAKQKHFVTTRGGGVEYAIKNTNESLSMLNRMTQTNRAIFTPVSNDTVTLTTFVEKSGYVFVRDRPAINHLLYMDYRYRKTISIDDEKVHCPFAMAKEPFLKKKRSFVYPIGSNLSDVFDPELLNLVESGIIKYLSGKGLPNAEICPQDLGGTERQLRNGDLMMTYYIMIAGFATAIVVFGTELLFRYLNGRQQNSHIIGISIDGRRSFPHPEYWKKTSKTLKKKQKSLHVPAQHYSNITPPPPYTSIFHNSSSRNAMATNSINKWKLPVSDHIPENTNGVRRKINGRDYMVFHSKNGQNQLIPMRAPSAALFQYTYTE